MRAADRPTAVPHLGGVADPYTARRTQALLAWIRDRCTERGYANVAEYTDADDTGSLDLVVAHRLVEREHDPRTLLDGLAAAVREGGEVVVVTTNRLTASPGRTRPVAAGHAWEYTPDELGHLLRWRFDDVRMFGVFHGRRPRMVERVLGRPLATTLAHITPADRAVWLRAALRTIRVSDFDIRRGRLADALDLIAVAGA